MYRQTHTFAQVFRKELHFLCLDTFLAAHPQGIADNNFNHLILADDFRQPFEVQALVLALQRLQALRRDTQQVRDRETDPLGTDVQAQNAGFVRVLSGGMVAGHVTIICPPQNA